MKKIRKLFENFLKAHYKLGVFFCIILISVAAVAFFYANAKVFIATYFGGAVATILRLITYKNGKIPIFMSDKTYDRYRIQYDDDEELDEKYKKTSIKRAAIYFIIALVGFFLWVICEILVFLFDT